jgi:hypothetical protein
MAGLVYNGKFEKSLNHSYSPENVKETAKKLAEYEKAHGPYVFGKSFTKALIPKKDDWANEAGSTDGHDKWEQHVAEIPQHMRDQIGKMISTNLKSANPLPMVTKIGENVDDTHEVHIKTFTHKGHLHIGLHILCPNTKL